MRKLFVPLALLILLGLMAGCGGKTVETPEGSVKFDDNQIEVKTQDGQAQVNVGNNGQASLPEGYPQDLVPIIAGATVTASGRNEDENKAVTYWLTLSSTLPANDVYKYYQDVLKDATGIQSAQVDDTFSIQGTKDNRLVSIVVMKNASEPNCTVQIAIAPYEGQ